MTIGNVPREAPEKEDSFEGEQAEVAPMDAKPAETAESMHEEYLRRMPWFREPCEAAKQLASENRSIEMKSGLTDAQLREAKKDFERRGDLILLEGNPYEYPAAYFDFLRLLGGFDCCSVHLYSGYFRKHKFEEVAFGYVTMNTERSSRLYRPIQYHLGECDHALYIFDARFNTYLLEGYGRETSFDDCVGMLLHAMWRARENIEGR